MTIFYALQKLRASALQAILDDRLLVTKSGDTSRVSNATLQADPHLTLDLQADYTYAIEWTIFSLSPAAADIQFGITFPAGADPTPFGGLRLVSSASVTGDLDPGAYEDATSGVSNLVAAGSALANLTILKATIAMSTTAGAVTLQWAQGASNAGTTTVYAGSSMEAKRQR